MKIKIGDYVFVGKSPELQQVLEADGDRIRVDGRGIISRRSIRKVFREVHVRTSSKTGLLDELDRHIGGLEQ